ncbi:hypothetical protein [Litorisediminicola beolgyonensis]|uniref:EF-hand domain-containing protein n=1 Tax=Litorisediminicola beolgyonensis TaxID=1173614 RepID=A0ABW3ZCI0_9RHOB
MKSSLIAICASLGLAAAAHAAVFSEIDTDGDDLISASEYEAAFGTSDGFERYDTDASGYASRDEVTGAGGKVHKSGKLTFSDIDEDDDGELDEEELEHAFGEGAQAALAKFDRDGDGVVTLDEVRSSDDPKGERGWSKWGDNHPSKGTEAASARAEKTNRGQSGKDSRGGGGGNNGNGKGGGGGNSGGGKGGGKDR